MLARRCFGKKARSRQRNKNNKSTNPYIQARRPGEKDYTPKYTTPDQDKEKELGQLQNKVHDDYRQGSYRTGLQHAQDYLKAAEQHFGTNHPATASGHNDVGLFGKMLGDYDLARLSYKKALKIYKAVVGTDHANYATQLHNLGILNRTQIHLDGMLKATDRLTLLEEAITVSKQAYQIRLDERGPDHPHTVASRSSWGAALAMEILQQYKQTSPHRYIHVRNQTTVAEWEAAEDHLRQALQTAMDTPRGMTVQQYQEQQQQQAATNPQLSLGNNDDDDTIMESWKDRMAQQTRPLLTLSASAAAQNLAVFLKARATTMERREDEDSNKSQNDDKSTTGDQKDALAKNSTESPTDKETNVAEQSSSTVETSESKEALVETSESKEASPTNDDDGGGGALEDSQDSSSSKKPQPDDPTAQANAWFQEAYSLYQDVLIVRNELLPKGHPDIYATQHSLAELLQAMGKEDQANVVRQEIIETYDPNNADTTSPEEPVIEKFEGQTSQDDEFNPASTNSETLRDETKETTNGNIDDNDDHDNNDSPPSTKSTSSTSTP